MSDTECSTLDELRRALGEQLRTGRQKARLSQAQLARRVGYSRSSVASAETGDHQPAEDLWARCDELLGAGGSIAAAYRELAAHRDRQARERARRAEAERDAKIQQWRAEARLGPDGQVRATASVPAGPPMAAADVVLVPYLTVAGTVEYVRMSRRAFVATGGLAAAMVAAGAAATDEVDRLVGAWRTRDAPTGRSSGSSGRCSLCRRPTSTSFTRRCGWALWCSRSACWTGSAAMPGRVWGRRCGRCRPSTPSTWAGCIRRSGTRTHLSIGRTRRSSSRTRAATSKWSASRPAARSTSPAGKGGAGRL
jgi:transcriptional regulator with XRE-family HTH domain